jgi:transcriptional antiterminator RfaH
MKDLQSPHPVLDASQDSDWFLAYSKPRLEDVALDNLLKQGFEAWCPTIKKVTAKRRKSDAAQLFGQEVLFPRYVFFRPSHPEQSISTVRSTQGVTSMVRFGIEFARLSHEKLIHIAHWVEQQQDLGAAELMGLKPGSAVKVTAGPLKGLDAMVRMTAADRVIVLLQLIGKDHEVAIPYRDLTPA